MNRMTLLALPLLLVPCLAGAIDFKGLEIGQKYTRTEILSKSKIECREETPSGYICTGNSTVANVPAEIILFVDGEQTLHEIYVTFSPDDFEEVYRASRTKYKKPSSYKQSLLQNAYGAKFQQVEATWKDKGNYLMLSKYGSKVTESTMIYSSKKALDSYLESQKSKGPDI